MTYVRVRWIHDFKDEPTFIYSELDNDRWEKRKVEVFPDGRLGYAPSETTSTNTFLGEVTFPSVEEISKDQKFEASEISREEFEEMWEKAIVG